MLQCSGMMRCSNLLRRSKEPPQSPPGIADTETRTLAQPDESKGILMSKSTTSTTASFETSNGKQRGTTPNWDAPTALAEFAGFGRENFEAVMKASTIVAQGYGAIGKHWMEFAKLALEQSVEATRAIAGSKNVKDAIEAQSAFARTAFDRYVSEANKISELGIKTATDAFEPLQKRADEVVAKYSRPHAA